MQRLKIFLVLIGILSASNSFGQSFFYLRNNAWLGFDLSVSHKGSHQPSSLQFAHLESRSDEWQPDTQVFGTERDSSVVPMGDSVVYSIAISHLSDSIFMDYRILRSGSATDFDFRLHGNGFDTGYLSDGSFHSVNTSIASHDLELKFKADNDDSQQSRNIRLAIHEHELYRIDSADFSDPNVINVMAYNIQMLPLGVVGMPQADDRSDLLPATFSPYQDVVIFEEAFDVLPRLLNLIPAMEAAGFVHNSGIVNDYLPFNGGVITFSKWPIEETDEYDFELCGPNSQDCFANKGIMYTKINKLGKRYHIFGTHFDAGSDSLDLLAKNLQFAEMRDFIEAQNIPSSEPAIFGGDFNTDPLNGHNLYSNLHDSLHPVVPHYSGFHSSTMSLDTGHIIDHIMIDPRHLLPIESEVSIETFRSIDNKLWDLSDFSDHRSAVGRFRFPDVAITGGDRQLCPGEAMAFSSTASIPVARQWFRDGTQLPITSAAFSIPSVALQDSGLYELQLSYSVTFGTATDVVNQLFFPNGQQTYQSEPRFRAGYIEVGQQFCPIAATDGLQGELNVFPVPANENIMIERANLGKSLTWKLLDLNGRTLEKGMLTGLTARVEVQDLPAGSYLLQIENGKGDLARAIVPIFHN